MNERPLVSIITPTYNAASYITKTMRSVMFQDYQNIQYIVIDDGSTDNTDMELSRLSLTTKHHWDKVTVVKQTNSGEQKAVNKGLSMVQGKYFMIVNADDPLLPQAISTLVWFMESHPDVFCAYPDWNMIDESDHLKMHMETREYDFKWMVQHHICIPSVGSMFRSSVIKTVGFRDTSYRYVGDFDYWLRIGLQGQMCHVPQTLATWRYHSGQASGDKSDLRAQEHLRVMNVVFDTGRFHEIQNEAYCWASLTAAYVCKSKEMFFGCLWDAFTHYPGIVISVRCWSTVVQRLKFAFTRQVRVA